MEAYREYWDAHATHAGAVKAVTHWSEAKYSEFYRGILADLEELPVKAVADVGCGPALMYPLIQELWPGAEYHGYDVSEVMLTHAHKAYPDGRYHLVKDELVIGVEADVILCHSVFTHIYPDTTADFLEVFGESLTGGGVVSASIHTQTDDSWKGGVDRIDIAPVYFELLVMASGLKILDYIDTAVPAGPVRYYRLGL